MGFPDSLARSVGLAVPFGLGILVLFVHGWYAVGVAETLRSFLLGTLVPALLSIGLIVASGWYVYVGVEADHARRLGEWCLVGAAVLVAGAVLTILYEQAEGVTMVHRTLVTANAAAGGGVAGLVVGVYDVRQRRARDRASRRERQLTVLNRVLRHDIRNEANVIWGRAELLACDSATDREHIRTIRDHAAALVEIGDHAKAIERMLRPEEMEFVTVDVGTVVESCLERLRREYPDVEIEAAVPDGTTARAHPLLESAVTNVLDNAVAHNDAASPRIEVSAVPVTRNGSSFVDLRVADNGPGIPESEVAVLERGYETPLAHSGGLGLWLVNWLVTAAGGEVEIETDGGRGSVVHLLLIEDAAD